MAAKVRKGVETETVDVTTHSGTGSGRLPISGTSVNHPRHYNKGKIEVIDFIEDQQLGFHLGNAVKYICREDMRGGVEDLQKAIWYIQRVIDQRES